MKKQKQDPGLTVARIQEEIDRRGRIWGDCPACAYKHLTAAYAAFTAFDARSYLTDGAQFRLPSEEEILRARAVIAEREAKSGYPGNMDLRNGCLAMAEVLAEDTVSADGYRAQRLFGSAKTGIPVIVKPLPMASYGYAHVTEALRELPELAEGEENLEALDTLEVSGPTQPVIEWLAKAAAWVRDTYELEKGDGR